MTKFTELSKILFLKKNLTPQTNFFFNPRKSGSPDHNHQPGHNNLWIENRIQNEKSIISSQSLKNKPTDTFTPDKTEAASPATDLTNLVQINLNRRQQLSWPNFSQPNILLPSLGHVIFNLLVTTYIYTNKIYPV